MPARTMSLLDVLTDDDRLLLQDQQNSAIASRRRLCAAEKVRRKAYRAELVRLDAEVDSINDAIMTGKMEKEISVEERSDYRSGRAVTFRLDTGEQVAEREITPPERQTRVPLQEPLPTPATEEQEVAETPQQAEDAREARIAVEKTAQRAGERAKARVDSILGKIVVLLPNATSSKATAKIGECPGFPWGPSGCTTDGETGDEARARLTSFMLAKTQEQEEALDRQWMKTIQTKVDEHCARAVCAEAEGTFDASVMVGVVNCSGDGKTKERAMARLRSAVVQALREELDALAQQQAADDAKPEGKRRGLKSPGRKKASDDDVAPAPPTSDGDDDSASEWD